MTNIAHQSVLDYPKLLESFPWLLAKKQKAIISPDTDGFLCGLFMAEILDWEIVGYYDGKSMILRKGLSANDCVFLDMDVFRKEMKSIGHHMVLYSGNKVPDNFDNYDNCVNPNNIRGFDSSHKFIEKYPFATIHLLLCILGHVNKMTLPKSAISPLLYVDGTFKNLLNYPENCVSWLKFLDAKNEKSPIYPLYVNFANRKIAEMIHDLEDLFKEFSRIAGGKKRGGDKIYLKEVIAEKFSTELEGKLNKILSLLSNYTGWKYNKDKWATSELNKTDFEKKTENSLTQRIYAEILTKKPLSMAITAAKRMEYTLDMENSIG